MKTGNVNEKTKSMTKRVAAKFSFHKHIVPHVCAHVELQYNYNVTNLSNAHMVYTEV
jgi:hypothetical protein